MPLRRSANPSCRATPIVAWHEVPREKRASKEPSRRVLYDRAQLIELFLNGMDRFLNLRDTETGWSEALPRLLDRSILLSDAAHVNARDVLNAWCVHLQEWTVP